MKSTSTDTVLEVRLKHEIVETVVRVSPGLAATHLEDIRSPVPSPLDRALHDAITDAVARCAQETGIANTATP